MTKGIHFCVKKKRIATKNACLCKKKIETKKNILLTSLKRKKENCS